MTEYDAFAIYEEQVEKDKVSAIEANNGLITYHFKDGTREVWKRNKLGRLYKFKQREL
tara:strand:+ start:2652 stop:2825 length:174 start_codon:yes stop_codon:yes gene_type:complete